MGMYIKKKVVDRGLAEVQQIEGRASGGAAGQTQGETEAKGAAAAAGLTQESTGRRARTGRARGGRTCVTNIWRDGRKMSP